MQTLSLIRDLSCAAGPSGFEDDVLRVLRDYAPAQLSLEEDSLRNLYLFTKSKGRKRPVVMLDAHSDEVGMMVQAIRPNGTLRFVTLGSWVTSNIPAHKVRVRTASGEWIPGIISAKPPHFMTAEEKNRMPALEELSIDVGASSLEEARDQFGIRIGAPVVPDVVFQYDASHDLMLGKAFDNRLGCAAVLSVMEALSSQELPVELVGAIASQEEIGTRGAVVTARRVQPDLAIVFEGCPADDTVVEPWLSQTALHKGPMLRHLDARMITHPRFQRFALDTAARCSIPVQEAVRTGGATNGAPIHLSHRGVPCIVIGFPVRYIHSHHGFATLSDFSGGVTLAKSILAGLTEDVLAGF